MDDEKRILLLGTNNLNKAREITDIFDLTEMADLRLTVCLPKVYGISIDVEETGTTYAENAYLKAKAIWDAAHAQGVNCDVLAEDSGLEVHALGGVPGLYTKRWAGENATDADRIAKLLHEMEPFADECERLATYVCHACLIDRDGAAHYFDGTCTGTILKAPQGENGFGYDPAFAYLGESFAELPEARKNIFSHRGFAMREVADYYMQLADRGEIDFED